MKPAIAAASLLLLVSLLAGCSPATTDSSTPTDSAKPSASASADESTESPTPTRSPTPEPTVRLIDMPTDCKAILSDDVLAQLKDIPLNDPAFGDSGVGADESLTCIWGDPAADTTNLTTVIERMNRGPALDMLNKLADEEGFTCFTPDGGTRCEKTWKDATYPVTDGRTLFWRENVLIDSRYSNLAPSGYTASIVASVFE